MSLDLYRRVMINNSKYEKLKCCNCNLQRLNDDLDCCECGTPGDTQIYNYFRKDDEFQNMIKNHELNNENIIIKTKLKNGNEQLTFNI